MLSIHYQSIPTMNKLAYALLTCIVILSLSTSCEKDSIRVPVQTIELSASSFTLATDSVRIVVAQLSPNNTTDTNITWTSSNQQVAIVDQSGNVKGISPGTTVISATSPDGKISASCEVDVIKWTLHKGGLGFVEEGINAMALDKEGNIWICGQNVIKLGSQGAWLMNNSNLNPSAITFDNQGFAWIGTGSGLFRYDGSKWEVFTTENSGLKDNSIITLATDNTGRVIASHFNRESLLGTGASEFDGNSWKYYSSENGLVYDNVISMAIDKSGVRWFVTTNGISSFDGEKWNSYGASNVGVAHIGLVHSVAVDSNNNKWFGTNSGLIKFDGTKWESFTNQNSGIIGGSVTAIAFDNNKNLWVATGAGLAHFDGVKWKVFDRYNHPVQDIRSILTTPDGKIYIGTGLGLLIASLRD